MRALQLAVVALLILGSGCVRYETKIPDVLDMRAELSGRHAPVKEVKTSQTRFWAFYFFTARHLDAGEFLSDQLDAAPAMGLRSITWESKIGPYDFLRWLAINGAAQAVGTALAFQQARKEIPKSAGDAADLAEERFKNLGETQPFTVPANIFIQSRTLEIRADLVTLETSGTDSGDFEQLMKQVDSEKETP